MVGGGGGGETESRTPYIKSLLVHDLESNLILGPQCQAESREVIKNMLLLGTIIMLVTNLGQTSVSLNIMSDSIL